MQPCIMMALMGMRGGAHNNVRSDDAEWYSTFQGNWNALGFPSATAFCFEFRIHLFSQSLASQGVTGSCWKSPDNINAIVSQSKFQTKRLRSLASNLRIPPPIEVDLLTPTVNNCHQSISWLIPEREKDANCIQANGINWSPAQAHRGASV